MMQDVRVALRQFRKSPGFTATVILTISLGIGANTAIFTLVHSVLLKSLPVANPASLYRIGDLDDCCVNGGFLNDSGDFDLFSYDLYRHLEDGKFCARMQGLRTGCHHLFDGHGRKRAIRTRHRAEESSKEKEEVVSRSSQDS